MNELKYIIVIPKGMTKDSARAIIFNGLLVHLHIWKSCPEGFKLNSAGFMNIGPSIYDVKCYGKSESLHVDSDPEFDKEIILRTLGCMPLNHFDV